jgi:hypothetical protein
MFLVRVRTAEWVCFQTLFLMAASVAPLAEPSTSEFDDDDEVAVHDIWSTWQESLKSQSASSEMQTEEVLLRSMETQTNAQKSRGVR